MAVIIQEVIGNEHNGQYYPEISGVAQSYNFIPSPTSSRKTGSPSQPSGWGPTSLAGKDTPFQSLPIPNYN